MTADPCPECKGEGTVRCPECDGEGEYLVGSEWTHNGVHRDNLHYERCERCSGECEVGCDLCFGIDAEDEDAA